MSTSENRGPREQQPSPSEAAHDATNAPPRESTPTTVASHEASRSEIIDLRPLIEPRGDGHISETLRGAYVRFTKIPIHARNLWFEEFHKRFRWLPKHDGIVRANWKKVNED